MLEHKHLIITGTIIRPNGCDSIKDTLVEVVKQIGMQILLPPNAVYCDIPENEGHTAFLILTTSHMAWHDWDRKGENHSDFQFDLYSCASFDPEDVVNILSDRHGLHPYRWKLFDRRYEVAEQQSYDSSWSN